MSDTFSPLLISTHDKRGGAALATYELHHSLKRIGINSKMLVFEKQTREADIIPYYAVTNKIERFFIRRSVSVDKQPLKRLSNAERAYWSINNFRFSPVHRAIQRINPSLIHLHWVGDGFIPIHSIAGFKVPTIWTLHDMWAVTGGCHYSYQCDGYMRQCGHCPQLNSHSQNDLSQKILNLKKQAWETHPLVIVGVSRWMADVAQKSTVFKNQRIEVIPNMTGSASFRPLDKGFSRDALGLPRDKKIILFGAVNSTTDYTKGFDLLQIALKELSANRDDVLAVVFGADRPSKEPEIGIPVHYLGKLTDVVALRLAYSSADVFVSASRAESFNKTLAESMACGTPTVAFAVGGHLDIIDHQENGYLAHPFDTSDLAKGVLFVLNHSDYNALAHHAREKVVRAFHPESVAQRYVSLYQEMLSSQKR